MSQEKMERYKAAKTNKEEIRKKKKKEKIMTRIIWSVVLVVAVGLIGFGIYISIPDKNNAVSADASQTISLEDLMNDPNFLQSLETAETDAETEGESDTETVTETVAETVAETTAAN